MSLIDPALAEILVCPLDKADLTEDVESARLECTEFRPSLGTRVCVYVWLPRHAEPFELAGKVARLLDDGFAQIDRVAFDRLVIARPAGARIELRSGIE